MSNPFHARPPLGLRRLWRSFLKDRGGNIAIMDVYAAQKMFGRGRKFDRIDLTVRQGRTIADCQTELRRILDRKGR